MLASPRRTISKNRMRIYGLVAELWPHGHMAIRPYGHITIWPYGLINVGLAQMDHQQKTEWKSMVWLPSYDHMAIWPYGHMSTNAVTRGYRAWPGLSRVIWSSHVIRCSRAWSGAPVWSDTLVYSCLGHKRWHSWCRWRVSSNITPF